MNGSETIDEGAYKRIIAIGDLHGYCEPFFRLLDEIAPTDDDLLVCIGDYVDRGPDSREVVQTLIDFSAARPGCRFLKGNHEDMLLGAFGFDACVRDINTWLYNGGGATLRSYGIRFEDIEGGYGSPAASGLPMTLRDGIPPSHLDFFSRLPLYIESENFFFCHAGVAPHLTVSDGKRNEFDLLWIRDHIHAEELAYEKTVVCGHTPLAEVMLRKRLVCVDTGLFYYGTLSAVDVLSRTIYAVSR
ncbi:MAG: serine/threonine protein phosphatase [Spirochaetes bacterium]|nr:serine/threonine protein phosphatase [Spirochaetota bacterium]